MDIKMDEGLLPFLQEIASNANFAGYTNRNSFTFRVDQFGLDMRLDFSNRLDTLNDGVSRRRLERYWAI